jgi:hypothetical protein
MRTPSVLYSILLIIAIAFHNNLNAQNFPKLDKSPMDVAAYPKDYKVSDKQIKITYSRPQLKERPLSKLAPNGKVWRTGANEAPELVLYSDMKFGDTTVKAGTYSFYVMPGEKEWTAIINTDLNTWGAYFYDKKKDVARLKIPVTTANEALEAFSIAFSKTDTGLNMHLGWGNTRVVVPFNN